MIESRNLNKLQTELTVNNNTIPIKTLEKDYVLSWVLVGIAKSSLANFICFKGGTSLKKIYFPDYRFSEDLDFTLLKPLTLDEIKSKLAGVYSIVLADSNIAVSFKSAEEHTNSYTIYLNYSGPLGADTKKGQLKTDFTIKEKLLNQPANRPILKSYTRYYDLPEGIQLKVYKLEEIFIEKYLCILDRMEPRDVYDLWYLAANQCLEFGHLAPKIKEKAIAKGSKYIDILSSLNKKRKNYETLWEARLKDQMIDLEHFDKVYRELTRALKPINILE